MPEAKKHHFVPQFLLKKFSQGKRDREKLWVFDKRSGRSFCASVKDTGHENHFYKARNLDGDEIEAESLTERLDGFAAIAVHEVAKYEALPLSGENRVRLSYFVALQMLRGPSSRNELEKARRAIIEKWGPDIRALDDERSVSEYGPDDSKFSSLLALRSVPEFAAILQQKKWFLLKAPADAEFILSDEVVVRHNHIDYWPRGSLGLNQVGIEVNVPITPHLAIQFLCPEIANEMNRTCSGRQMLDLQQQGRAIPLFAENIEFVNSLQVIQSERFVYARSGGSFAMVREMLSEHPDLAIPASEKIIAG